MIDNPEPLRLHLAQTWPDRNLPPDSDTASVVRLQKPPARKLRCAHCGGELVRSRVRFYERLFARIVATRPYRCLDCWVRRWR